MATTIENFEADIADISLNLVKAYGLTYGALGSTADGMALQRWMDYRLRYIAPQPRRVERSVRFPMQNLPEEVNNALAKLKAMFENGEDVNPYLSKTTIGNDVSASRSQRRTDGLWADWRIHHLHLTVAPLIPNARFSKRSNWLLFVMVYEDVVAFIDIREHNESDLWTNVELFETFIESWPELAEPYRIARMVVDSRPTSPEEYKLLRTAGINTPVEHNDEHYFGPGQGLTMAITSTAASMDCIQILRNAQQIAQWLDHPENSIRINLRECGITEPNFNLGIGDHGLSIVDFSLPEKHWVFPEFDQNGQKTSFSMLSDRLLPAWAIPTLMTFLRSQ